MSLSDGGAHCGVITDASFPTYLLSHWVRDRSRGARFGLEEAVKAQTADTAALYGLHDRGVIALGMKADMNVIDFERCNWVSRKWFMTSRWWSPPHPENRWLSLHDC